MKKTLLIALLVTLTLFAGGILAAALGDTMHPANQRTIAWDPADNATAYLVYARADAGQEPILLGETAQTQFTVTLATEGVYRLGVSSIRREVVNDELTTVAESEIAWSDDPAVCAGGETFGIYYFTPPAMVANLQAQ